ncbi:MAG: isocitrate lyase/phosphoenolpyruvate mutase family protein [Candidatus Baltobacteraceae bacterium]
MHDSARADRFFALHIRGAAFALPNVWDAASARLFEVEGFPAIATSSSALANSLGYADGERVDVEQLFAALERIARVVEIPLSADLEAGFGHTPEEIANVAERAMSLGVVGMNLEDLDAQTCSLRSIDAQQACIAAIRARAATLGVRFFVNARTDIILRDIGDEATQTERTIERLRAYAAAGADGVFAPGTTEFAQIATIAEALDAPLNVLAGPGMPSLVDLRRAGVARVSLGSRPALRALGAVREIAVELRERGTFAFENAPAVSYAEANAWFGERNG